VLKSKHIYKQIPWKQLKREDFVNWPNDVGLYSIADQGRQSLTKLYSNLDRIDFTRDFIDQFARSRQEIIPEIENNLLIKLNEGLKTNFISMPWYLIKRKDLVNWPIYIPVNYIFTLAKKHLISLHENLDSINFTQEFFDRHAFKPAAAVKDVNFPISNDNQMIGAAHTSPPPGQDDLQLGRKVLIAKINLHLLQKLNEATRSEQKRIPWEKLAKGDLVNWPWRMTYPSRLELKTLKKIHENLDSICFKPSALKDSQI
jgi:hypothetical protein